ncbi:MAG: hypothetical protein CMJ84_09095 [Planctomycetes bacterium]|nr:hypothetical protein [Planctomycetota bacterium]MDP6410381.1 hypothetical protein [Planctomycetota bacterium]
MTRSEADSVAPGVREELLAPLRRTLDWMLSLRDGRGRIVCPEHRVEHGGKSAGAIVVALELRRMDPRADRARLAAVALEQGRRLVSNLEREGTSPAHTFRPGRHDPFNCSNSVIDGGAASDALAQLVGELGEELEPTDTEALSAASLLHARTYLRYAALDKGIPAQRAWGLTGLAAAWALEHDDVLEDAAMEAIELLGAIQHPDGSYPYHPLEWGAEHVGASDVSAYYQSRVTAFVLHALERLGRDPGDAGLRGPLVRGLAFLSALTGPDGIKCGLVEAKPWYWGATYEVASHPFDTFALARGWRHFGGEELADAAVASFRAWAAHLDADGRLGSHRPGPGRGRSYQCPVFWAGHAMWMARAAEDLEAILRRPPAVGAGDRDVVRVRHFSDASLARIEDGAIVAWVRGRRPGVNVHHGSPHGAGLLRVVRRADGAELLERCRLGGSQEAEWSGCRGLPSPRRGWRAGGRELRFSLWLARVHLRARRFGEALRTPWRVLLRGVAAFAHPRVSSAFALAPALQVDTDGVLLRGPLAWRDGMPVEGTCVERRFSVDGGGLRVHERLAARGAVGESTYRVPQLAAEVVDAGDEIRYRLS